MAQSPVASTRPSTSETIALLHQRVSVRQFTDEPVSDDVISAVLNAAFRAPTSSNIQSYNVVVVRRQEAKEALAKAAGNQQHVIACPVFLAFCADLSRIDHAMGQRGLSLDNNNLEVGLVSSIDASLVGMAAYLAAESVGLRGVMIGGARNHPDRFAEILGLPYRVYCVFGMCLGYPAQTPKQKPRMAFDAVVHQERFEKDKMAPLLQSYDTALAEHYRNLGRPTNQESWSHEVAEKFKTRPRDTLRTVLSQMGFDFA